MQKKTKKHEAIEFTIGIFIYWPSCFWLMVLDMMYAGNYIVSGNVSIYIKILLYAVIA